MHKYIEHFEKYVQNEKLIYPHYYSHFEKLSSLKEGEQLRKSIRGKYDTVEEAAELLGKTRRMLYNYFDKDVLELDFKEDVNTKLGIKIISHNVKSNELILNEESEEYINKRQKLKTQPKEQTLMYYEIGASAGNTQSGSILPINKNEGVLHISDLFKGSQFAIRISGNSMMPNYPSGAIIGIREIEDKIITPGSVYVIEKGNDLWIKRLFYSNDDQSSGIFECVSDNTMLFEVGARKGKPCYPPFNIEIDKVRKLFKVTGIYKPNELTVIN